MYECGVCGETIAHDRHGMPIEEAGEFTGPDGQAVYAHADCGYSAGYSLA